MSMGLKPFVRALQIGLICVAMLWVSITVSRGAADPKAADPKAAATKAPAGKAVGGKTNAAPAEVIIPKSVFTFDAKTALDPFYPQSVRLRPPPPKPVVTPGTTTAPVKPPEPPNPYKDFTLKGITGPRNNRLALISTTIKNYDLAVGDALTVKTPSGSVKLKCLEIKDRSIVIMVEGAAERKELLLPSGY